LLLSYGLLHFLKEVKMKINLGDIIIWILFFLSISVGLWYLFGNSPTFEQAMIVFLVSAVFTIVIAVSRNGIRLDYLEKNVRDGFGNVKINLNNIQVDMDLIKKKLKI